MEGNQARERAEFLILELCDGSFSHTEIVAQMLASIWISGDCTLQTMLDETRMIVERTMDLMDDGRQIWPRLMPGGIPSDAPESKYMVVTLDEMKKLAQVGVGNIDNIILDYPVIICFSAMDSALYAAAAEVFRDEHGVQWIKFIARNGHEAGKEHIMRTDGIVIVRDETFKGE